MKVSPFRLTVRLILAFLCVAMLLVFAPRELLVKAGEALGGSDPEVPAEETDQAVRVVGEMTDERTAQTKTFRMSDGSFVLAEYTDPVHYEASSGVWTDYDNTLKVVETDSFTGYENTDSDVRIRFAETVTDSETVSLQSGPYRIGTSPRDGTAHGKVTVSNPPETAGDESLESAFALTKYSSSLVYEDVFKNIDLQYILRGGNLKENIIVKEPADSCSYSFDLHTEGLVPAMAEDGSVLLKDQDLGEIVFTIPAGYMIDAAGEYSDSVWYSIEQTGEYAYILTVSADPEWMNAEGRTFPVTVDPSVYAGQYQTSDVSDTTAVQSDPSSSHGNDQFLRVGSTEPVKKNRTYIRLNTLPALPSASIIADAELNLRQLKYQNNWKDYSGNVSSMNYAVREVTSAWSESTLTWNNQPSVSSTVIDYRSVTAADTAATEGQLYSFHITSLMQKWYEDAAANFGVAVYPVAEQTASADDHAFTCFYSSNNPYPENQTVPFFTIKYYSTAGLDNNYTYHTQSLKSASGYINDYTGNLIVIQDLGLEIDDFPFDLSYVFNNCFRSASLTAGTGYGMNFGFGWHFSAVPILKENLSGLYVGGTPVEYIDGDGTSYFLSYSSEESCYVDEEDLGYSLYIPSGGASLPRTLKTGDGWELEFTSGRLTNVSFFEDENASPTHSFDYVYTGNRLIRIEKDSSTVLTLAYNSDGLLTSAADAKGHTATFTGSSSCITGISTSAGEYTYQYGPSDDLLRITETDTDKEIRYSYNSSHRVSLISEYYDGNAGDCVAVSYPNRQTVYRTRGADDSTSVPYDDILTTYQFDSYGRVTNVFSRFASGQEIFSAAGVGYYGDETFAHGDNNVRSVYRSGFGTVNLLKNPSAEDGATDWTNINGIPDVGIYTSAGTAYTGNSVFRIIYDGGDYSYQGFEQAVTLTSGKTYTLSAYVRTQNVTGSCGAMVGFLGGSSNPLSQSVLAKSEYLTGTTETDLMNGWRRIVARYTPSSTGTYYAYIGAHSCTDGSTVYYDAVQLEEGPGLGGDAFSDYNLIQNAGFENGSSSWTNSISAGGISVDSLFGSFAQKISGDPDSDRRVVQYTEHIPAGQSFVLSGWAKADSVSLSESGRSFEIRAELEYDDNTTEEKDPVEFNPDESDWQYASDSFAPAKTDTGYRVKVSLCYDHNCGDAYFDNVSLTLGGVVAVSDETSNEGGEGGEGSDGELTVIDSTRKYQILDGLKYTYTYDGQDRIVETVVEDSNPNGSTDKFYTYTDYYTEAGAIDLKVTEQTDERGCSTKYKYYNEKLYELVDGRNHTTSYSYSSDDLLTKLSQTIGTLEISNNYVYNGNGDLTGITHKEGTTTTQSYSFTYDVYGNLTSILQGSNALVTYAYNPNNGKLISATYANGFVEGYGYDYVNNLSELKRSGVVKYRYLYDRNNVLQYTVDTVNGTTERYEYDADGMLVRTVRYRTSDQAIQLITEYVTEDVSGETHSVCRYIDENGNAACSETVYDADHGRVESIELPGGDVVAYTYDVFGRSTSMAYKTSNGTVFSGESYSYLAGSGRNNEANASTHLVETIDYSDCTWLDYTYDANGNILTVSQNGVLAYGYEYDDLDQLTRETDVAQGTVTLFEYDWSGNILAKHEFAYWPGCPTSQYLTLIGTSYCDTVTYTYGNSAWGDQLTGYDGVTISYDGSGSPLNWTGGISNMTWTGRELSSFVKGNYTYSFKYNAEGIRTEQTKWYTGSSYAEIYHYVLDGTKIVQEYTTTSMNSTPSNVKQYYYDANDAVIGFRYSGADYYFRKNLQGDVIAIINSSGTKVVEYTYSAWGEVLSVTGTLASTIGQINPFRYRGYYFDKDTGFYYLKARYYDSVVGRFISFDDVNQYTPTFVYCENNPINMVDGDGHDAILLLDSNAVLKMGHIGLYIQYYRQWYYWYWGPEDKNVVMNYALWFSLGPHANLNGDALYTISQNVPAAPILRKIGRSFGPYSTLFDLNRYANQFHAGGTKMKFDKSIYIKGDFQLGYLYLKILTMFGQYNLLANNCMQTSIDALMLGNFRVFNKTRKAVLATARGMVIPVLAFAFLQCWF